MSDAPSPPPIPGAPHSSPAAVKPPFAKTAAQFCAWSPLFAIVMNVMLSGAARGGGPEAQLSAYIGTLIIVLGIVLGIFALCSIPRHGRKGILAPAVIGLVVNISLIVIGIIGANIVIEKSRALQEESERRKIEQQQKTR